MTQRAVLALADGSLFHGHDDRIDVGSLALATDFWIGIAEDLLT